MKLDLIGPMKPPIDHLCCGQTNTLEEPLPRPQSRQGLPYIWEPLAPRGGSSATSTVPRAHGTTNAIKALCPTLDERRAQLDRLERWCLNAPRWKRETVSAGLGAAVGLLAILIASLLP